MNLGSFMPTNPSQWSLGTLPVRILRGHPDLDRESLQDIAQNRHL